MRKVKHIDAVKLIRHSYNKRTPLFLWGTFGIGKSTLVREVGKIIAGELNLQFGTEFQVLDTRTSQLDASDLRGLPHISGDETVWVIPSWFPRKGAGIWFFDELNLSPTSVQAAAYQLILDRKLGDYELPEGWVIIAAGNRGAEDRSNTFEMPAPLKDRFLEVGLEIPTSEEWGDWAIQNSVPESIVAFVQFKPSALFSFDCDSEEKASTPRGWERAGKLIKDCPDDVELLVATSVGNAIAKQFSAFLKIRDKIDIEEIMKNPEKIGEFKNKPDLLWSLISLLAEQYRKDEKKLDKIAEAVKYVEAEYGMLLLKFLRQIGGNRFREKIAKSPVFDEYILPKFSKLLN